VVTEAEARDRLDRLTFRTAANARAGRTALQRGHRLALFWTQPVRALLPGLICIAVACSPRSAPPQGLVAQVSGTIEVPALAAPVRIVRDRWGVPHIYSQTQDDLFFAQGFVQAQDRLFQMDLWRRAAQGRLSHVLGANFIERDAMTRRFQYRGDLDAEWASYGPDARAIAAAFVRGINMWVARALEQPPEEFVRAGWKPAFWTPVDLLNRTDAFLVSGDAVDEVRRSRFHEGVADAIRRVGTPPFFSTMMPPAGPGETAPRAAGRAAVSRGASLAFSEAPRTFEHPSARYVVHLKGPGWNVIGMTSPWRPGVAAGHNERVAWAMMPVDIDTQDLHPEPLNGPRTVFTDAIVVKGRSTPFVFETELAPHGTVVALDRAHAVAYALRWSGTEAGAAPELASLAVDRARSWIEFRAALQRWKMPPRRAVYADVEGNAGFQDAVLVPVRRAGEWSGWLTIDALPHAFNPPGGAVSVLRPAVNRAAIGREAVFAHVLGASAAARKRFYIGPLNRPADDDDSPVQAILQLDDWDRSRAMNAPGQSGSADSPHFADLARLWSAGEYFPLAFTDEAVQANAEATLMLVPQPR
jgi:penicillin G amidase